MEQSAQVKKIKNLVEKQRDIYTEICDTTIFIAQKLHGTVSHGDQKKTLTKSEKKKLKHWLEQYLQTLDLLEQHILLIGQQKERLLKVNTLARPKIEKIDQMLEKESN